MTDEELRSLYRDITAYLKPKRLLGTGQTRNGVCVVCGDARLHVHGVSR